MYHISRSPVRQALNELAYEGVLVRRPGLGTFVNSSAPLGHASDTDTPIQVMTSDRYRPRVLDRVAQAWNAQHPTLKVTFQTSVVDHSQLYDLLRTAVGSGAAPDLAMVDSVWVAGLARSGFLYALEDLNSQTNHTDFVKDLYPAFVEANSFDGRLYGLPVKADASLLWYRKDWFAQEKLKPPRDWDGLLEVGRHFLQPQVQERYGLLYPLAFPGGAAGGRVFSAESVVLDAQSTRRALQFLRELVIRHRIGPPEVVNYRWDTTPWLFASGKVAMALGGSYESDIIRDASGWGDEGFLQRVDCVAPPAAPGGDPVSTVGGSSYVILRQCECPTLAMDLIKIATSPEVVGDLYLSMLQNSPCPSFDHFLSSEAEPLLNKVSCMIASGRARPSIPEYVKVSRQLQAMFGAALSGTAPVGEIVRRTAEFIGVISEQPCQPA